MDARLTVAPPSDVAMLVGWVVVHDEMEIKALGGAVVDFAQEAQALDGTMTRGALPNDRSLENIESGEHGRGAMALVIGCPRPGASPFHREPGSGVVKGLDGWLLIDAEDPGVPWRVEMEPDEVTRLLNEAQVAGLLEDTDKIRDDWNA